MYEILDLKNKIGGGYNKFWHNKTFTALLKVQGVARKVKLPLLISFIE